MSGENNSQLKRFDNLSGVQRGVLYGAVFAVAGLLLLAVTRAASPFVAIEPETATLTTGATTGLDAGASGGQYVQFGQIAVTGCSQTVSPGADLNSLMTNAGPNEVICLNNGNYGTLNTSVSRTNYVTLRAVNKLQAVFADINLSNATFLRFESLNLTGEFTSVRFDTDNIQIVGNRMIGIFVEAPDFGSASSGPSNWLVEKNDIENCDRFCVLFNSADAASWWPVTDMIIRGNKIGPMAAGDDAIRIGNWQNFLIEDNEIFGVIENGAHNDCLQSVWGGKNITYRGNYLHDNNCQTFFLKDGYTEDIVVDDNLFLRNAAGAAPVIGQIWTSRNVSMKNNTFWNEVGFTFRTASVAPQFSTGPVENYEVLYNVMEDFTPYDDNANTGDRAGIFLDPNILTENFNVLCGGWTWVPTFLGANSQQNCNPNFQNATTNAADDLATGDFRLANPISVGGQTFTPGITWQLAGRKFGTAAY